MSREQPAENAGKIAIILAPDDKGRQTVFGIPTIRRLALLARQVGFTAVHVVGLVKTLQPILFDLIPPERFHPAENPASLRRVVEGLALPDQQRVLVLKSNCIIDRVSLRRLIEAGESHDLYCMEVKGKNDTERLYFSTPPYLVLHPSSSVVSFV